MASEIRRKPQTTKDLSDFMASIDKVCEQVVAPNAISVDEQARNPVESWDALHEVGALAMLVPEEFGGLGFDLADYVTVVRSIARHCAATAMTLHMHSCACRIVATLGTAEQKKRYLGEVVSRRTMLGSWASEPNVSLSIKYANATTIRRTADGYTLDGRKHFCTMAGAADYGLIWAALSDDTGPEGESVYGIAIVPNGAPGMAVSGSWNPMGMRGTVSPGVVLDTCPVPEDGVLRNVFDSKLADLLGLGFAGVMIGVAEGALDTTIGYLASKKVEGLDGAVAETDAVQRRIGHLTASAHAAALVVEDASTRWDASPLDSRAGLTSVAKYAAAQAALEITRECMDLVGGLSAVRGALPLERAYRDIRTASLMPPNTERMLVTIGRDSFGYDLANLP